MLIHHFKTIFIRIKERRLIRDVISITFITTIGKAIGFFVPFFIALWFGVTEQTDAFFFSYGLIIFFSGIIAPVIESVIVPFVVERTSRKQLQNFIGQINVAFILGVAIISIALVMILRPGMNTFTSFTDSQKELIFQLFLEIMPIVFFSIQSSLISGVLNSLKLFLAPALMPLVRSLVTLLVILILKDRLGIHSLAVGYAVGEFFRYVVIYIVFMRRRVVDSMFSFSRDSSYREFLKVAGYQVIGMLAVGLNPIIDKAMGSWLPAGNVSILHYADRLYMIPITFLTSGFSIALLSHWSERFQESGSSRLLLDIRNMEWKAIKILALLTFVLVLMTDPLIQITYGQSPIENSQKILIGEVWIYYLIGLLPYVLTQIYVRCLLILKDTISLCQCAIGMFILNIILNIALMRWMAVAGLALSTSLVGIFTCIFLRIILITRLNVRIKNDELSKALL